MHLTCYFVSDNGSHCWCNTMAEVSVCRLKCTTESCRRHREVIRVIHFLLSATHWTDHQHAWRSLTRIFDLLDAVMARCPASPSFLVETWHRVKLSSAVFDRSMQRWLENYMHAQVYAGRSSAMRWSSRLFAFATSSFLWLGSQWWERLTGWDWCHMIHCIGMCWWYSSVSHLPWI